MKAPETC